MSLELINKSLNITEQVLNLVGYVPFIGSYSAGVRALLGKAMVITGLAIAAITLVGSLLAKDQIRKDKLKLYSIKSMEYAAHGVLNIGRAMIESIPFLSLVTCLPYDWIIKIKILHYTNDYRQAFATDLK